MNNKDKLVEATVKALQGKLTESKYTITYYDNTATRESRPETKGDVETDWVVIQHDYNNDLQAYEDAYLGIVEHNKYELEDLYKKLDDPNNDEEKVKLLKEYFESQDLGFGEPIIISIKGGKENYDSGITKESLLDSAEDDEDDEDDIEWEDEDEDEDNKTPKEQIWSYLDEFQQYMLYSLGNSDMERLIYKVKIDYLYMDSTNTSHIQKPRFNHIDKLPRNKVVPTTVYIRFWIDWLEEFNRCFLTLKVSFPEDANPNEIVVQEICVLDKNENVINKRTLNMKPVDISDKHFNPALNFAYGTIDEIIMPLFKNNKEFFDANGATPFKL